MDKLISIIIPIHNAEKYLNQCIDSVLKQTYNNLEILLIDDCSTDRSAMICDQYANTDKRIRVIHRESIGGEGGAKARNQGISLARGEYLYFMDSDDIIEKCMLEELQNLIEQEESDCVVTSFRYVDTEGKQLSWQVPALENFHRMEGKEAAKIFLTSRNIEGFSWNKLWKKDLFERYQIHFDEQMNSFVDMYGMFQAVLYSKWVSFYPAKWYAYRQHSTSCVHTITERKLNNYKRVIQQISTLASEQGFTEESQFFVSYRIVLQLFDAIKARKNYDNDSWMRIKKIYCLENMGILNLFTTAKLFCKHPDGSLVKMLVKLAVVWWWFR